MGFIKSIAGIYLYLYACVYHSHTRIPTHTHVSRLFVKIDAWTSRCHACRSKTYVRDFKSICDRRPLYFHRSRPLTHRRGFPARRVLYVHICIVQYQSFVVPVKWSTSFEYKTIVYSVICKLLYIIL